MKNKIIVFTKSWKDESLDELATMVKEMGFDGVELPVRDGYQVTPKNVKEDLPKAVAVFKSHGLEIGSVAGSMESETVEAMGSAGIKILRVCLTVDMEVGYFASVKKHQDVIMSLKDCLLANNVKIGIQNHHGFNIGSALGLHDIMNGLDNSVAGAVLDFAHCGLDGEPISMALDIVKDSMIMVNFKSAYCERLTGPDELEPTWQILWSTAKNSLYSWKEAIALLKGINYDGYICLPAEYDYRGKEEPIMGAEARRRVEYDLNYLKTIM
ncbi:MAG: sugar phosphate isomerase/epimerase [Spirochaetales bacterium]